ncbi:MAG: hypothetical protein ACLQPH_03775 [Acidimicrobiales bacterium]
MTSSSPSGGSGIGRLGTLCNYTRAVPLVDQSAADYMGAMLGANVSEGPE